MGGGEKTKTNQMLQDTYNQAGMDYARVGNQALGQYNTAQDRQNDTYTSLQGHLSNPNSIPIGDYSSMDDAIAQLRASKGSVDVNAMRQGEGTYKEFMETGGLSEAQRADMRSRGTSTIPAMYAQMRAEAARQGAIQGGQGPGQMAMMARMGRDQSRSTADAALNTELGITQQVNAGREWGTTGLSQLEEAIAQAQVAQSGVNAGLEESAARGVEGKNQLEQADRFNSLGHEQDLYNSSMADKNQALQAQIANRNALGIQSGLIGQRYEYNRPWYESIGSAASGFGSALSALKGMGVGGGGGQSNSITGTSYGNSSDFGTGQPYGLDMYGNPIYGGFGDDKSQYRYGYLNGQPVITNP